MAEKFDPEAKLKIPTKMQAKDHVLNKVVAAQQSIDINTIHSVPEGNKQTNLLLNKRSEWKLTDHRIEDSSKLQSNQNTLEFSDSIPVTSKWLSKSYDSHKFEKVLNVDQHDNKNVKRTSQSSNELNENIIVDVTVEELDKAIEREISQNKRHDTENLPNNDSVKECDTTKEDSANIVPDFQTQLRNAEKELHDMVQRTARISLTSSNLDLSIAKNLLKELKSDKGYFFSPEIKTEYVKKVLLSYFYFVRMKDAESCKELHGKS